MPSREVIPSAKIEGIGSTAHSVALS